MRVLRSVLLLVVAVACLAPAPAAVAQDTPPEVSSSRQPADPVFRTVQAGWTVWSERIAGRWWVLGRNGGRTRVLDVPPSAFTQDPGVGRGPGGRPVVAHQRCGRTACALWVLDLATKRSRQITWAGTVRRFGSASSSSERADEETHPRVLGDRLVFQTRVARQWRVYIAPVTRRGSVRRVRFGPPAGSAVQSGGAWNLALGPKHLAGHWVMNECGSLGQFCGRMDLVGLASGRSTTFAEYSGGEDCSSDPSDLLSDGKAFSWRLEASADASSGVDCPTFVRRDRFDPRRPR